MRHRSSNMDCDPSAAPEEALRRSLLGFAGYHDEPPSAESPAQALSRFRRGFAGAKRRKRFVRYAESDAFADEIAGLLVCLFDARLTGPEGVEETCRFFEADAAIMNACDDSNGSVGNVFTIAACDLLSWYGSRCDDKGWLTDRVYHVTRTDEYGVRGDILTRVGEYLPEESLRSLAERLRADAEKTQDIYVVRGLYHDIASLAEQLNDGPMYETAIRASVRNSGDGKGVPSPSCVDIARVYFNGGDPVTALSWIERVPEDDTFTAYEREPLLLDIQKRLGNHSEVKRIAWRIFRCYRTGETLDALLAIVGPSDRERLLDDETRTILNTAQLSCVDAEFLVSMGRIDDAERYLLRHVEKFDGEGYTTLLRIADAMETAGKFLVTSLLYRALLDAILARGISKYYVHGVRYLHKLDTLAASVQAWKDFDTHTAYVKTLETAHARKSAFWGRYAGTAGR